MVVERPERTMTTGSGPAGGGGAIGAAAETMPATAVAGGLGIIMGLTFGSGEGRRNRLPEGTGVTEAESGFWLARGR